MTVYKKMAGLF